MTFENGGNNPEFDSLSTDVLEDGVAGSNNQITSIFGNDGETEIIGIVPYLSGTAVQVSSTSFAELGASVDRIQIVNKDATGDLTNRSGDIKARFSIRSTGRVDQAVTVRIQDSPNSEVTFSSGETFAAKKSDWVTWPFEASYLEAKLDQQTNGDVSEFQQITVEFGKVIGQ